MPLEYPTYSDLVNTARAALRNAIPTLDPTISNSWAKALVDSIAAVSHSNNLQIRDLEKQLFPQTATDEFLDRWLEYEGLARNPASSARGNGTVTGISGGVVPTLTQYESANGLIYENQVVASVVDTTISVDSLTRIGTTATAYFTESHGLATGNSVTFSGAVQAEYNGTFDITVLSETDLTYTVVGSPLTPATGTILADSTYSTVLFKCTTTGKETNLAAGAVLTIVSDSIPDVDDEVIVGAEGLTGGGAIEDDESARSKLLLSRSGRSGIFTPDQIKLAALSINGNTRVFVISPEFPVVSGGPVAGQVFIYFLRDNDVNPLPSSTIVADTKQAIIKNGAMPAHTVESDVVVGAPIPVETDYTFSSISPDTTTMRTAIEAQLDAFYKDSVQFGEDITEAKYLGAITNTIDTQTGAELDNFQLSSPSGDISINFGEIGFLGTVNFL